MQPREGQVPRRWKVCPATVVNEMAKEARTLSLAILVLGLLLAHFAVTRYERVELHREDGEFLEIFTKPTRLPSFYLHSEATLAGRRRVVAVLSILSILSPSEPHRSWFCRIPRFPSALQARVKSS